MDPQPDSKRAKASSPSLCPGASTSSGITPRSQSQQREVSPKFSQPSSSSRTILQAREVNQSFYELDRPPRNPKMQLLFFHGLQFADYTNAHLLTWQSGDGSCIWPQEWLVEELPGRHVLYVSYDSRVGESFRESVFDLTIIAENLTSDLMEANIGQQPGCPVILVGHSIGGLVIKQVCYMVQEKLNISKGPKRNKLQNFLDNLRGMFFYGTPHYGSPIAEKIVDLYGGPVLDYFRVLSKMTARLNQNFDILCQMYPKWRIEGVGESKPTRMGTLGEVFIVPEASSRRDDFNVVDGVDHFTICKPMTKTKRSFYKLKDFLFNIVGSMKEEGISEIPENFQYVPESVIGIDGPQKEIIDKLVNSRTLGLVGMGGIGKTTLAKAIFNSMSQQFEYSCFVPNVKLIRGEEKALKDEAWKQMYHQGKQVARGVTWSNLRGKKLLLFLDDISEDRDGRVLSELAQITASESRLIFTSRDKYLAHNWGDIYEVPFLKEESAAELFRTFAFPGQAVPPVDLGGFMQTILEKCDGLPLTLEVLGKYLKTKRKHDVWKQTLHALDEAEDVKDLNSRLWAKLRPSFEGLGRKEQQMFLDATTFFSHCDIWRVKRAWTLREALAAWRVAYETSSERILWQTLVDMSLVYQVKDDETIKVHEQLRSLGRKIASEPSYNSQCRVWDGKFGSQMIQSADSMVGKEFHALRLEYEFGSPANAEEVH